MFDGRRSVGDLLNIRHDVTPFCAADLMIQRRIFLTTLRRSPRWVWVVSKHTQLGRIFPDLSKECHQARQAPSQTVGWIRYTNSCRYSVGLAPHTLRKTRAKCCWLLKPQATATSSTRISAVRNISLARSTLRRNTNWCGLCPVDSRNICEK